MPIMYKSGDMFAEPTEAIVNTVNTVGVMGKGVALEFKKRWPQNYKAYRELCDKKLLSTGEVFIFDNANMFENNIQRYLINFPTKAHWRSKSKLSYVEDGLDNFVVQIKKLGIKSVSMPPLGCGNGGLDWDVVKPLMETKLAGLDDIKIIIFSPKERFEAPEFEGVPEEMTVPRAALIKTMGDFENFFGGHLTRLSIQKLTYFLQILGVNFGLSFRKEHFGPYSETLHKALKSMEANKYIQGYSSEEREVTVTQAAFAASEEFLKKSGNHGDDKSNSLIAIKKLSNLIEGFESPFGMELLSSVHYLHKSKGYTRKEDFLTAFAKWNGHKKDSFGEYEVTSAIKRLTEDALMN